MRPRCARCSILESRVIAGKLALSPEPGGLPKIMVGKGIAERFHLKVGDTLNIVVPLATEFQAASFRPKLGKFTVAGVINYGRFDFDSRYVVMQIADAQEFVELGKRITGYRLENHRSIRGARESRSISPLNLVPIMWRRIGRRSIATFLRPQNWKRPCYFSC